MRVHETSWISRTEGYRVRCHIRWLFALRPACRRFGDVRRSSFRPVPEPLRSARCWRRLRLPGSICVSVYPTARPNARLWKPRIWLVRWIGGYGSSSGSGGYGGQTYSGGQQHSGLNPIRLRAAARMARPPMTPTSPRGRARLTATAMAVVMVAAAPTRRPRRTYSDPGTPVTGGSYGTPYSAGPPSDDQAYRPAGPRQEQSSYNQEEIITAGHSFFGAVSKNSQAPSNTCSKARAGPTVTSWVKTQAAHSCWVYARRGPPLHEGCRRLQGLLAGPFDRI